MISFRFSCGSRIIDRSFRTSYKSSRIVRGFASSSNDDSSTSPEPTNAALKEAENLLDTCSRGVGQVIFLNSTTSGAVIMGGLAVGNPGLAAFAALGALTATATAKAAGLDEGALKDGLWTYNGCLIGCAASVFGPASMLACTSSTILGAAATPFASVALKETMTEIPQWTYSFNLVALTSLLRTRPLLPAVDDVAASSTEGGSVGELFSLEQNIEPVAEPAAGSVGFVDLLVSPFTGISQIFVVESAMSGAIIVYGIGMYSPGLVGHALMGSTLGTLVGAFSGADVSELAMGLWGYNSALTSMAVGVFFVNSTPAIALSAGGAAATAAVFGAMKAIFGAYGAPCLTLPFCTTMSACYLMRNQIPGLAVASSPHSPEKNTV